MIAPGETITASDFTGLILMWGGAAAPTGWLLCQGQAVSRATYADLFAIIGTTYGEGDGSTTFNLPDMKGRTVIGSGTGGRVFTLPATAVSSNQITVPSNRALYSGQAVAYAGSGITGLSAGTYYVIRIDATHIKLAATQEDAVRTTPVPITISGTPSGGTLTQTFTATALGEYAGEETHVIDSPETPKHVHGPPPGSDEYQTEDGSGSGAAGGGSGDGSSTNTGDVAGSTNAPMNNLQPSVTVNFIIKT